MCLAKAYLGGKQDGQLIMEEVASLKVSDGRLFLTTLFGEQRQVEATISEIDFMANRVVLEKPSG